MKRNDDKRNYELYLRIGKILAADAFIYSLMVVDNVLQSIGDRGSKNTMIYLSSFMLSNKQVKIRIYIPIMFFVENILNHLYFHLLQFFTGIMVQENLHY